MKPFDIEKAKKGAKVRTRHGRPVSIEFYDNPKRPMYPVSGYVQGEGYYSWTREGRFLLTEPGHPLDLFLVGSGPSLGIDWRRLRRAVLAVLILVAALAALVFLCLYAPTIAAVVAGVALFAVLVYVTYISFDSSGPYLPHPKK